MGAAYSDEERAMLLARITSLKKRGHSAREIADTIGGITRNAVIGLLFRARKKREAAEVIPRVVKPKAVPRKPVFRDRMKLFEPAVLPPRVEEQSGPGAGVPLMETRANGCRWIVARDARGALYCDQPRAGGRFYQWCPHHYERGTKP